MILDGIKEVAGLVGNGGLLPYDNASIGHRKSVNLLRNIAHLFIVNAIKALGVNIKLIVLKILQPSLIIRHYPPRSLP